MKIKEVALIQVKVPLSVPYVVSTRTITEFDPIIVHIRDEDGTEGWGEALISPGYTYETLEGAWRFCSEAAQAVCGKSLVQAQALVAEKLSASPGAASAMLAALDMLTNHPVLYPKTDLHIPLLAPVQGHSLSEISEDVEKLVEEGFRTLKIKVGFDWKDDLRRVEFIQKVAGGRTTLRLDANRSYKPQDAIAFAESLDPTGIELFEQPCGSEAWADNAVVAERSHVPIMLDESIYDMDDVRRAASIKGVKFVKLKLKKIGSIDMLRDALDEIRRLGMIPVLGDGVSLEIGCWMEACVAAEKIDNAGEMNGFLKTRDRLFVEPLAFSHGTVHIPSGYQPVVNIDLLNFYTTRAQRFQ